MNHRLRLIAECEIRIESGDGDKIVHKTYTWKKLKENLEHGCEISKETLKELQNSLYAFAEKNRRIRK